LHISHPIFLLLAALVGGALNSVAGGGSFITFPSLLFVGMAPIAANATNTAALWPGTVASTVAYRNAFDAEARRLLPPLLVTGTVGGVLGAHILLRTPQSTFLRLVPWLLLAATLLFVFSGRVTSWIRGRAGHGPGEKGSARALLFLTLFLELIVAIYVGYFGAGSGILILALVALLGVENIHTMNGMKTLLVSVMNGVAVVTFIWGRVIVWPEAVLMLVAASVGGYGGAYLAQKMNAQHVRRLVIVVGLGMSLYFFIRY
jgi:uncharacterized membrane protein YfcA